MRSKSSTIVLTLIAGALPVAGALAMVFLPLPYGFPLLFVCLMGGSMCGAIVVRQPSSDKTGTAKVD